MLHILSSLLAPVVRDVHSLVIRSVRHAHGGVYKSVISNKVGKATCYAHLYVTGDFHYFYKKAAQQRGVMHHQSSRTCEPIGPIRQRSVMRLQNTMYNQLPFFKNQPTLKINPRVRVKKEML